MVSFTECEAVIIFEGIECSGFFNEMWKRGGHPEVIQRLHEKVLSGRNGT